jgi:hypothetical protein
MRPKATKIRPPKLGPFSDTGSKFRRGENKNRKLFPEKTWQKKLGKGLDRIVGKRVEKRTRELICLAPFYSGYKIHLGTNGNGLGPIIPIDLPVN